MTDRWTTEPPADGTLCWVDTPLGIGACRLGLDCDDDEEFVSCLEGESRRIVGRGTDARVQTYQTSTSEFVARSDIRRYLPIPPPEPCAACGGSGVVIDGPHADPCPDCAAEPEDPATRAELAEVERRVAALERKVREVAGVASDLIRWITPTADSNKFRDAQHRVDRIAELERRSDAANLDTDSDGA